MVTVCCLEKADSGHNLLPGKGRWSQFVAWKRQIVVTICYLETTGSDGENNLSF